MSQTIDGVYRDFKTAGVPTSGEHEPRKSEIRALLKQIQNSGGMSVTRNTATALLGVTPPTENYMGVVLDDPDATKNGYYSRVAGVWTWERGFPETAARLVGVAGTGNAPTASTAPGVDPGQAVMLFFTPRYRNTGAMTLSVNGAAAKPMLTFDGQPMEEDFLAADATVPVYDNGTEYRLLWDHRWEALATQTRADRDAAIVAKDNSVNAQVASETAQGLSEDARDLSLQYRNQAKDEKDAAVAAAEASGSVLFFNTKAAAVAAALVEGQVARIFFDESRAGAQTFYRKEGAALVFKLDADQRVRDQLGAFTTSIQLFSSPAGGDDYDSTARLTLESYQRPHLGPYGESLRFLNKSRQAKSMTAIYHAENPNIDWHPVTNPMRANASVWHGAHWGAQDTEDGLHKHWSVEVADASGELQTRWQVFFGDPQDPNSHGLDHTLISTNATDFAFRSNSDDVNKPGIFRIAGTSSFERILEFSKSNDGWGASRDGGRRWQWVADKVAEGGGLAGVNLALRRFGDSGEFAGTVLYAERATGNVGFGIGLDLSHLRGRITSRWAGGEGFGFYLKPSAATSGGGSMIYADGFAAADRVLSTSVQGETATRFILSANGVMQFGPGGVAGRDVSVARTAAGVLSINNAPIGKKVSVPASRAAAGVPGDWSTNGTKLFIYIGDGTTHDWSSVALAFGL